MCLTCSQLSWCRPSAPCPLWLISVWVYACCSKIWSRNHSKHGTSLQTLPAAWPQVFLSSGIRSGQTLSKILIKWSSICSTYTLIMYATTHIQALLSQVSWRFWGPKRIRAEVLYHSIKRTAHLLRLSKLWSCVSRAPYCGVDRPTVPQPGRSSPGHRGLLKLSGPWSHQRLNRKWSYWLEIMDSCWMGSSLFTAQASSDWSLQNLVSQVHTAVSPGI